MYYICLLYTSDAADERSSVDLGGRRIIKKKKNISNPMIDIIYKNQYVRTLNTNNHDREVYKIT